MEEYDEDLDVICPYCGNDVVAPDADSYCLAAGTVLSQRYVLGRVLGDGGFGITYIGYDKALKRKVAVKEYFPNDCVTRQKGETEVSPFSGERGERYERGLKNFQTEAQRLAKLGSIEGVVNVYDVFAENSTAYIVMEYLSGETVAQMVEGHKFLGFGKTMNIIVSVLKSLKNVHNAGVIHRDISPKNIIKTKEGKIVLIDFGAAKPNTLMMSRTASVVLTQGYAPIEQYDNNLSQGTWTDIYAVAATMYYMLTGVTPDSANSRLVSDTLAPVSELHPGLPDKLDDIIKDALAVRPEDRTQTAGELLEQIWTLRNAQNTTRKPKAKKSPDQATTINIPPVQIPKSKLQQKPKPQGQWKTYAGGPSKPTEEFSKDNIKKSERQPHIITIQRSGRLDDLNAPDEVGEDTGKQRTKVSVPLVVAAVILVMVLGGLAAVGFLDKANNVQVPDFVGQNIESVLGNSEYQFDFETIYTYDPDTDLDIIISQSPVSSARHVKKDSPVRLTVNSLETEVSIPVLAKMSETAAVNTLNSLYLKSDIIIVNNDEFSDGTVVSSEPANGSKVKVGSTVTLYVAQNSVKVPSLYGKTLQQATDELTALGLAIGEVTYDYSDEYDTGCVMSQGIESDTKVVKGTAVTVVISSGKPVPVTLETTVDLTGMGTPFTIKAVCDGTTEYERKRYSLVFEDSETISVTRNINEGTKVVEIYIDDELYCTYHFDFESGVVTDGEQYEVSAQKRRSESSKSESSKSSSKSEPSRSEEEPGESAAPREESQTSSQASSESSASSGVLFPLFGND